MKYSSIQNEMDNIKKICRNYQDILKNYSEKSGKRIIASPCFFIPPEINSAFDIVTLKIPEFLFNESDVHGKLASIYDAVVIPGADCYCGRIVPEKIRSYIFNTPNGFGEDSAVSLHNEISKMLNTLFNIDLKSINIEILQRETLTYEKLRRMIRSISTLRQENKTLLGNSELSLVFETAVILPPEIAIEYISPLLEEMKKIDNKKSDVFVRAMLYGGKSIPAAAADFIEESGIVIMEDDSCTGRRLFDISLNAVSEYIFYELLDAYSYRPLMPCMRPANERYELLYKLLKNYSIDTVIFYRDERCSESVEDIDYLRVKMMRDGIDPLVIDKDNYGKIVSDYMDKVYNR